MAGDDFEGFGEGFDDGLLLVGHVAVREVMQGRAEFHLAGAAAGDDALVLDGSLDYHDGVVEASLDLGDELFGAAAEDERACSGGWTTREKVESLGADLDFFKGRARAEVMGADVGAGGLD